MNKNILLIPFAFLLAFNLTAQNWIIQSIGNEYYCRDASIAVDVQNIPHIAYTTYHDTLLKYAKPLGNTWECQFVDSNALILKICLDAHNYPHIAYLAFKGLLYYVRYAYWNGSVWQIIPIDSFSGNMLGFERQRNLDMALSQEDIPYISYPFTNIIKNDTICQVRCAYKRSNTWVIDTIWKKAPLESKIPYHTRIAFDINNVPYVAFNLYRGTTYTWLNCARYNGSTWDIVADRTFTDRLKIYGFKVDNIDRIHLVYYRNANLGVYYALIKNNIWTIELVAGSGLLENLGDLALYHNQPHIVISAIQSVPRYFYKINNMWQSEIIAFDDMLSPSLFIDNIGNPHISFLWWGFALAYARRTASGIEAQNRYPLLADRIPLKIYSNPATSVIYVRAPFSVDKVTIYDVTGKVVKEMLNQIQHDNTVQISLDGIKNGVYFVKVNDVMVKEKLIITK